ncbi:hypothetical protein [Mycobacterium sp. M23085]|uniref:hypothetical protein n=1 Tax=Mycobacterium sp. M23085 TaxID=3378087 RepID=UPI0038779CB1
MSSSILTGASLSGAALICPPQSDAHDRRTTHHGGVYPDSGGRTPVSPTGAPRSAAMGVRRSVDQEIDGARPKDSQKFRGDPQIDTSEEFRRVGTPMGHHGLES